MNEPSALRILSLDVGEKKIGLAFASNSFLISPLKPLTRNKGSLALNALKRAVTDYKVQAFVIGLPLHMDGSAGIQADSVKNYVRKIIQHFPKVAVFWQDERLSTRTARESYPQLKLGKNDSEINIDSFSAMEILKDFLAERTQN